MILGCGEVLLGGVVGRSCCSGVERRCCREMILGCGEVLLGGVVER